MAKTPKNKSKSKRKIVEKLVPIACTADAGLARQYKRLLRRNHVKAAITSKPQTPGFFGFAIVVPEKSIDDACRLIEADRPDENFFDSMIDPPNPNQRTE